MTDNINTETIKEELNASYQLIDDIVNELYEYVYSIFQLREYKNNCMEYPVTCDFAENLLKNIELYTAYTNRNHDEMKRIIAEKTYNRIKESFDSVETYLIQLHRNLVEFSIHLLEQTSWNVIRLKGLKQEEEEKGGRH